MIATEPSSKLYLPPAFALHEVPEDAYAHACRAAGAAGAGALFLAQRPGVLGWALVLEPEEPLATARRAFPVAMAAAADALAALCLPERSVGIAWPDTLLYDTSRIGGGRLAWAPEAAETEVPEWLAVGFELIADRDGIDEPGRFPGSTSLKEELFEDPREIVESFARNLMLRLDIWQVQGFDAAAGDYLRRLVVAGGGTPIGIGKQGELLVRAPDGKLRAEDLVDALEPARWFDPVRGGPRL